MDDEIKVYTEEDHFNYAIPEIRELAITLHERIMELEGMECTPVKHYMGYKYQKKVVADIEIQKKQFKLRINLKKGRLKDPQGMFRDMSQVGHLGLGPYEAILNADTDMEYLMGMVKQGYRYIAGI